MQQTILGRPPKFSRQRELILQIIRATHIHPTADWIYGQAREQITNISLGTVYRNLNLLKEEGKIREICLQDGIRRYDGDLRKHYHARCTECGCLEDIPLMGSFPSTDEVEKMTGFYIQDQRLEFLGICPECRKQQLRDSGSYVTNE